MHVRFELYASLMKYLPPDASRHSADVDVAVGTTANALLDLHGIPLEQAHLVLRNGVFLYPEQRDETVLEEGDVIAVWPPVAGG